MAGRELEAEGAEFAKTCESMKRTARGGGRRRDKQMYA